MTDDRTFTNVDNAELIRHIGAAQRKIVFVAPGIHLPVAAALAARMADSPNLAITAILDINPEVCRLGFGDIEGLTTLKSACEQHGSILLHQPGIRIGLIIADDNTLIYSPTPLLIEAGSKQPDKPNAIRIATSSIPAIEAACSSSGDDETIPEIGLDAAKAPDIEDVKRDLELNPPQKFDVSRAVRVFNSVILYVEFKFEDYKITLRKVDVPAELLGFDDDQQLADRWQHIFTPFRQSEAFCLTYKWQDENGCTREEFVTERTLEKERHALKRRYIKDIHGHGAVIMRHDIDAFKKHVAALESKKEAFKKFVVSRIAAVAKSSVQNLVADLWPRVCSRDLSLLGWKNATEDQRRNMLTDYVTAIVLRAVEAYNPKIICRYKAVAYESIKDSAFRWAIMKAFGESAERFFHEYDAAPGSVLVSG